MKSTCLLGWPEAPLLTTPKRKKGPPMQRLPSPKPPRLPSVLGFVSPVRDEVPRYEHLGVAGIADCCGKTIQWLNCDDPCFILDEVWMGRHTEDGGFVLLEPLQSFIDPDVFKLLGCFVEGVESGIDGEKYLVAVE